MTRFINRKVLFASVLSGCVMMSGCIRDYDKPEYAEIDTAETGFLIPLEGDSDTQAKFASEKYLEDRKVAAKRVQITHRWSQLGRMHNDGQWIAMVKLIKVKRSPVTREWTAEGNHGTSTKDQAIWTESGDSVGFSMGFTCTALIKEEDAAKFLYYYPSGSLAEVMDTEIRARVQKTASEIAAKYKLDDLRARKQEIVDAVTKDVTAFFETRGISVTTVGMFGGMTYENVAIQKAIDETFIAQQQKDLAQSRLLTQQKENEPIQLEATATAEKARREAQGQADAKLLTAKAEAESIREINKALSENAQNPLVLQLKLLEVEKERVSRWNGQYPTWFFGPGASTPTGMVLNMSMPQMPTLQSPAPQASSH